MIISLLYLLLSRIWGGRGGEAGHVALVLVLLLLSIFREFKPRTENLSQPVYVKNMSAFYFLKHIAKFSANSIVS